MIIENTRFGTIEIEDDKVITMRRSIPGFSGRKRFIILNRDEIHPFLWYQSIEDPALAFVILNPFLLISDYSVDLVPTLKEMAWQFDVDVDSKTRDQLAVFVLVNASSGVPEKMTANLMAPLIVNTERLEAVQIIIQEGGYSHRHPLFGDERAQHDSDLVAASG